MVIFYLHCLGLCGGIRVVLEMASRLHTGGVHCEVWTPPCAKASWFGRPFIHRQFNSLDQLGREARKTRAKKIATWWETAYWVVETLAEGDKGYYLTQDIETSYSQSPTEDTRVLNTYQLGLTPLTTSEWVNSQLRDVVKSNVAPRHVSLGVDMDIFSPLPIARETDRIFTPYRPQAGPRDLKGWLAGRHAAIKCQELHQATSIVTFGTGHGPNDLPVTLPHIHVNGANDIKMRELYSQAGVFLMPSNHEGFGLTALEAMACGCPVVATECDGNAEYCANNINCLLLSAGDGDGLGAACAAVMDNQTLASRLGYAGIETARHYNWGRSIKLLRKALDD